jgi:hypothetical protein
MVEAHWAGVSVPNVPNSSSPRPLSSTSAIMGMDNLVVSLPLVAMAGYLDPDTLVISDFFSVLGVILPPGMMYTVGAATRAPAVSKARAIRVVVNGCGPVKVIFSPHESRYLNRHVPVTSTLSKNAGSLTGTKFIRPSVLTEYEMPPMVLVRGLFMIRIISLTMAAILVSLSVFDVTLISISISYSEIP